jgi:hypothetical protein
MDLMNAFLELRHSLKAGATTPVKSESFAVHSSREEVLLREKQELE